MKKYLLIMFALICTIMSYAQLPDASEYQGLMALYAATNGPAWTNKSGWNGADPEVVQSVQGWYGVTTDVNGHVTALNLHQNNLVGNIPSSFGQLIFLRDITLFENQLSGNVPSEIGYLVNVERFWASQNSISGSIPEAIGNMQLLKSLDLSHNQLMGSLPSVIATLIHLEVLNLVSNQLTGTILESLGQLVNLKSLYLAGNQFSGTIPGSLGDLDNLEALHLHLNQLTGSIPPELGQLDNLLHLALYSNALTGNIPVEIGSLTSLQNLNLSDNQLSGPIPSSIGSLEQLTTLDLSQNNLSGPVPSVISNLNSLISLILAHNDLSGTIPSSLANLGDLEKLYLYNNSLSGSIPSEIASISSLNELAVSQNQFTFGDILPVISIFTGSLLNYTTQAQVDEEKTIQGGDGYPLTLTTNIDRATSPSSLYQWFKKVNGVTTALNTPSSEGHTVTISTITQTDNGTQFYYQITNTSAPDLTLTSKLQTLQVIICTAPTIDFITEELNGTHTFNPTFTGEGCTPTFTWDFGDGTTSDVQAATHAYSSTGAYTVLLTVNYTCGPCPAGQLTVQHDVTIENSFCGSIYCDGAGGVGIGTQVTEGFRLSVNGKIRASDIIKVYPQGQWSDFVFEKDYKLLPLSEVETFIKANGHLPEIPSAKEVEKEGIDLGGMDAKLLQKIEELTLYLIELKKENEAMKKQIHAIEQSSKKTK